MSDRIIANEPDFRVLAEGDGFVVVDKPAPLLVHPSTPGNPPTLLDGLQELLAYEIANGARLSIINRLDRETSGVVLVATSKNRAREFHTAMQKRRVEKRYAALCHGTPAWENDEIRLEAPILRRGEIEPSEIWVKQMVHPDGAPCATGFRVLERLGDFTLVEALPETGRMHQIRVHLAHLGHPVGGDKIYGEDERCYLDFIETGWTPEMEERLLLPRHALHSTYLALTEEEGMAWEAPFPRELLKAVQS